MKSIFLIVIAFVSFISNLQGQENLNAKQVLKERGEVYFKFPNPGMKQITQLSKIISIDKISDKDIYAYANQKEFSEFETYDYNFEVLTAPSLMFQAVMKDKIDIKGVNDWDYYPTYTAYLDMMIQFQTDYPDLCQVFSIGQTVQGRELMMARISDNVGQEEGEPQFLYTSSIHGDELTGYVLMLRLIDYLLSNYGSDPEVDSLVNNLDIWINPLANPDGTFHGGNNTVNGAIRYNANFVDMNRNYPDPEAGPHPDGNAWQPETMHFMALADSNHFVLSTNFHGGAEVCNYPWDTWQQLHPDDDWWQFVCREYADTAHINSPSGYMNDLDNGITNGYAWYTITGGRQDFMNYFHQCREFTAEISSNKTPPASSLPSYWNYNHRSLINYMKEALYGITGNVTSAATGNPVMAKVFIENHDADSSWVFSNAMTGKYFRPVYEGTYDITFSAAGYYPQTIENVTVTNHQLTQLDVQLQSGDLVADFAASATNIPVGTAIDFTDLTYGNPDSWSWTFEGGTPETSSLQNPSGILYSETGSYNVTLIVSDGSNTDTIIKQDYIQVSLDFVMQNNTFTTCEGIFYDSGGNDGQYSNNEDYTMTFLPGDPNSNIKIEFTAFNIEFQQSCNYDWLRIYNGSNAASTLIGEYCGTDSPGTITASNEDGALTFVFHSDESVTESGWAANISCESILLAPIADFTADSTTITEGGTVHFTDLSLNLPDSWNWIFEGGTPTTSEDQNPVIQYNTPGTYDVMQIATNAAGADTMFKESYIVVEDITGFKGNVAGEITVYPNPASGSLNITSTEEITSLTLTSLEGTEIVRMTDAGKFRILDISQLDQGIYILKIIANRSLLCRKIQVIH